MSVRFHPWVPAVFRRAGFAILAAWALPAAAQVLIQFDFGSFNGTYSGTNAPGHVAGDFKAGLTTWNEITADASSGLLYADGAAASGISVDVGLGNASAIDWNTAPGLGNDNGVGVFATPLGDDNLYTTDGNQQIIGMRVSGLAPGTYDVYAIGRGVTTSQQSFTYNQALGVGNVTAVTFADLGGPTLLSGISDPDEDAWVDGQTHLFRQVTIASPADYLVFLTQNATTVGGGYAAIQGLQIAQVAAVPEPSTYALYPGIAGLAIAGWRRRRAQRRTNASIS
jgi:hypothetical protein